MAAQFVGAEKIETKPHPSKYKHHYPDIHGHDDQHIDHMHQTVHQVVYHQFYLSRRRAIPGFPIYLQQGLVIGHIGHEFLLQRR